MAVTERPKANGGKGQVGFQQPLEFQKRLVVEADVIELLGPQPGLFQAVIDGLLRKVVVVFVAGEAFLLRGGNDLAVDHQRRGRVVVKSRDAENGNHWIGPRSKVGKREGL